MTVSRRYSLPAMPYESENASVESALWPPCEWPYNTTLSSMTDGASFWNARVASSMLFAMSSAEAYVGGGLFAHYTTHIEHVQFGVVLATFAVAYPILGGLSNVFGTLLAVIFIQGFLIEGLRFMGDWRNLLFGGLIVLAMNVRPRGLIDAGTVVALKRFFRRKERAGA